MLFEEDHVKIMNGQSELNNSSIRSVGTDVRDVGLSNFRET
jgi:hypothetical protein